MAVPAYPAPSRSASPVREFRAANPCPSTGRTRGACPGWQVDHIRPLCDGGRDHPSNLQWLTVDEHRIKTRSDLLACRRKVPSPISD